MNKLTALLTITLLITACQKSTSPSQEQTASTDSSDVKLVKEISLEDSFWNSLAMQCDSIFKGLSSYPSDAEDSFFGKELVANFNNCTDTQIQIPFHVGDNTSRTWIFSRLENGKIQLKHQHLHDDGSVDEVSNYGGTSDGGEVITKQGITNIHVHFPADDFTKQLLPEASTNVWTIELISDKNTAQDVMTYNLYRHSKKRFIASLSKTPEIE